jgi:hypothetical protein
VSPTFELLRFEATPLSAAVAVVELEGEFVGPAPARPRLLVESGGVAREMPALEAGGVPWSASFAVPLAALGDRAASFALVPGRGPLVELPAPTQSGDADDDRFVELARTANDLRHRLSVALDRAEDREHLASELVALRERLAAAEQRVTEAHEAALNAREEQARAEGEADEAREAVTRAREEARAEVRAEIEAAQGDAEAARAELAAAQERAVAAEDEARAARLELRDARARIEALVRESRTARTAAARERIPTATSRIRVGEDPDTEFRAARLGPDWDEGAREDEPEPAVAFDDGEREPAGEEDADEPEPRHAPAREPTGSGDAPHASPIADRTDSLDAAPPHAGNESDSLDAAPPDTGDDSAKGPEPAPVGGTEPEPGDGPGLWRDDTESVRILRPRTRAGRRRPAAVVDVAREEDGDFDDAPLEPAAVGARLIRPAEMSPRRRAVAVATSPRAIVGGIFLLLIVALVLIFSGAGPV